jgi:hypothetical protein
MGAGTLVVGEEGQSAVAVATDEHQTAHAFVCVVVAGGVAGLPCVSEDSRSWKARPSHIVSWSSLLLPIAMVIASSLLMSGSRVSGSHAGPPSLRTLSPP